MAGRQGPSDGLTDPGRDPSAGQHGLRLLFESFSKTDSKSGPNNPFSGPTSTSPMVPTSYQPDHVEYPQSDPGRRAPIGRGPPANAIPLASATPQKIWILEQDLIRQAAVSNKGGSSSPHPAMGTSPIGSRPIPYMQHQTVPTGHTIDQSPSGSPSSGSVLQRLFPNVRIGAPNSAASLERMGKRELPNDVGTILSSDYVMDVSEIEGSYARQNSSLPMSIPNSFESKSSLEDNQDIFRRPNSYLRDVSKIEEAFARLNPLTRSVPNSMEAEALGVSDAYLRQNEKLSHFAEVPAGAVREKFNPAESSSQNVGLRQILGKVLDVTELEGVLATNHQSAPVRPPPGFEKYSASSPKIAESSPSWLHQRDGGAGFPPKEFSGMPQNGISLLSKFRDPSMDQVKLKGPPTPKIHPKDIAGANNPGGQFSKAVQSPVVGAQREAYRAAKAAHPLMREEQGASAKKSFWDNFSHPGSRAELSKGKKRREPAINAGSSKMESLAQQEKTKVRPISEGQSEEEKKVKKKKKKLKKRSKKTSESAESSDVPANAKPEEITKCNPPSVEKAPDKKKRKSKPKKKSKEDNTHFEDYMTIDAVMAGLQNKTLLKGEIRINARNYKECYINDPNEGKDILIAGTVDRNRAMEGDVVVVQMKDKDQSFKNSQTGAVQITGKVVYILEKVHSRICVGQLTKVGENDYATFCPRDSRIPRILIPSTSLPVHMLQNPGVYENDVFLVKIITWDTPGFAQGLIEEKLGKKGEVDVETRAILKGLMLDENPVPESLNKHLPSFTITQEEIDRRLDLRKECIFTIDPSTARDLDDAVSVKKLGEDLYEVGVHIADVSYFLNLGTPLDEFIAKRATTVYMVDKAIHMLPLQLCLQCSLLPGQDKYAISVIWQMKSSGKIIDTKFARTVIHSCAKLSYEHAQAVIEGKDPGFPPLHNNYDAESIREAILMLYKISQNLTQKRFEHGALRIIQPKISFKLDEKLVPTDAWLYELKDSNRLIEEFMLQANQSVAQFIHAAHPKIALLRRHPAPKTDMMARLIQSLETIGIELMSPNSEEVSRCIRHTARGRADILYVLGLLFSRPMMRAEYFCFEPESHHYALNIDMYTHFTSPIRRYVDIVVHRVLCATLGYNKLPEWETSDVRQFCWTSNQKKLAAKRAGELSCELFTALYIRQKGQVIIEGIVHNVISHALDILIIPFAMVKRVYLDRLPAKLEYVETKSKSKGVQAPMDSSLTIWWNHAADCPITYRVFSKVLVRLSTQENGLEIDCYLQPPVPLPTPEPPAPTAN